MLEKIPTDEEMIALIGQPLFDVWTKLTDLIETKYDMERLWNSGGKSLFALYAKEKVFGFMIISGKAEREKVEAIRNNLSSETQLL